MLKNIFGGIVFAICSVTFSIDSLASDPVHDCSSGCYVVTCSGTACTLWRCDSGGCHAVAEFDQQEKAGAAGDQPVTHAVINGGAVTCKGNLACTVRICDGLECSLWGLRGAEAKRLGVFDDPSPILQSMIEDFLAGQSADRSVESER